jgi:AraC family transcriptional regulator
MTRLISPDELPLYAPGELVLASKPAEWAGVQLRSYRYKGLDVPLPPVEDYLLVAYQRGTTAMHRRFGGRWHHENLTPGDTSLLTRAEQSYWQWRDPIEVVHIYLSPLLLPTVCAEAFDRDVGNVELRDILRTGDAMLYQAVNSIAREVHARGVGGRLYVEALASQICVQLLRNYINITFVSPRLSGALSLRQAALVHDYIEQHLSDSISLAELAAVVGLSQVHFIRLFRERFACPPHAYLMSRRIDRAKTLLARRGMSIQEVATSCGFSDQSHLTRLFKRHVGITPRRFQLSAHE